MVLQTVQYRWPVSFLPLSNLHSIFYFKLTNWKHGHREQQGRSYLRQHAYFWEYGLSLHFFLKRIKKITIHVLTLFGFFLIQFGVERIFKHKKDAFIIIVGVSNPKGLSAGNLIIWSFNQNHIRADIFIVLLSVKDLLITERDIIAVLGCAVVHNGLVAFAILYIFLQLKWKKDT